MTENAEQQFVYIFRDKSGQPVYVGRGAKGERPLAHFGDHAHNEDLTAVILSESVTVQMAGPLKTLEMAEIVEGALISAFRLTPSISVKLKNKNRGAASGRFRPLGVPTEFVDRAIEPPLTESDLLAAAGGRPVVTVLITKKDLGDGRDSFDMALGATDHDITEQMVKWWPIGRKVRKGWQSDPASKPALLIAMSGSLRHRLVVGALEIDQEAAWQPSKGDPDRFTIPTRHTAGLDFGSLRGRLVSESIRSQQSGIRILPQMTLTGRA